MVEICFLSPCYRGCRGHLRFLAGIVLPVNTRTLLKCPEEPGLKILAFSDKVIKNPPILQVFITRVLEDILVSLMGFHNQVRICMAQRFKDLPYFQILAVLNHFKSVKNLLDYTIRL